MAVLSKIRHIMEVIDKRTTKGDAIEQRQKAFHLQVRRRPLPVVHVAAARTVSAPLSIRFCVLPLMATATETTWLPVLGDWAR